MKFKYAIALVLLLMHMSVVSFAEATTIIIDDEEVLFNESLGFPFVDENNRTQVPFRATLEMFGAQVSWDSMNNMALAEKNGIVVGVPIGQNQIFKNGTTIPVDSGALIKEGRTYLPIRAVMEAFGCEVVWDSIARAVIITPSPEQPSFPEIAEVSVHFITGVLQRNDIDSVVMINSSRNKSSITMSSDSIDNYYKLLESIEIKKLTKSEFLKLSENVSTEHEELICVFTDPKLSAEDEFARMMFIDPKGNSYYFIGNYDDPDRYLITSNNEFKQFINIVIENTENELVIK